MTASPQDSAAYLAIGEILGAYGIRGGVWVRPLAGKPGGRHEFHDVMLVRGAKKAPARLTSVRTVRDRWIVTIAGTDTRDDAQGLKGWLIALPKEKAPRLPEGTHYVHDILGRRVFTEDDRYLGEVVNILATGGNDVYIIEGPDGELLFPALRSLVLECPREGDTIRVRIPPGLLEACLTRDT